MIDFLYDRDEKHMAPEKDLSEKAGIALISRELVGAMQEHGHSRNFIQKPEV